MTRTTRRRLLALGVYALAAAVSILLGVAGYITITQWWVVFFVFLLPLYIAGQVWAEKGGDA